MDPEIIPMETEMCHNCKREVPQANYLMHVVHCQRNMAVCPICGDAVPKANLKEHRTKQHSLIECKECLHKVQSGAMEHHKKSSCGRRFVACPHCELELPKSEMADHENYCGSRTERCDECGELVMLKYKKLHIDSNHGFLKLDDEPGPTPSWEISTPVQRNIMQKTPETQKLPLAQANPIKTSLPKVGNVEPMPRTVNVSNYRIDNNEFLPPRPSESITAVPQRSVISPYDATEDLRAKVKLVRHGLNEIKQSYLMTEGRKERVDNKYSHNEFDITQTSKKTEKFTTNLVPYEKNESHKINAGFIEDNPKNYYNYLGEKETPPKMLLPAKDNVHKNIFSEGLHNGEHDKTTHKTPVKVKFSDERKIEVKSERRHEKNEHKEKKSESGAHGSKTGAMKKVTSPNGAIPKRNEQGAVPKRRKAPPPPVNVNPQNEATNVVANAETEDVILPCEFCMEMIPASRLVQHETGCRPDLAQIKVEKSIPTARPPLSPEVELPCEFCFDLIPASKLLSHQALCDV